MLAKWFSRKLVMSLLSVISTLFLMAGGKLDATTGMSIIGGVVVAYLAANTIQNVSTAGK
jgi:hypothetical protein